MNQTLLRRVKRLEARFAPEPPLLIAVVFVPSEHESGEWAPPDENDAPTDLPEPKPECAIVSVFVSWLPTKGRNCLTSGERIVRDWYHDKWQFYARERITKDPGYTGRRCQLQGKLAALIQETEDDFERDLRQAASVHVPGPVVRKRPRLTQSSFRNSKSPAGPH